MDDDEVEVEFDEAETEEILEGLYRPGAYHEGEVLCLEILEEIAPDWEPARLYLLLNLAALDAEEEALQMVDELADDSLFEALRHLTFGADTVAEELVFQDIIACARSRGLGDRVDEYFATRDKALGRQDIRSTLAAWDEESE